MSRSEEAEKYFSDTFNCSQAVFAPFGKEMGLDEDQCLRIATSFGGGMGRQQLTCGAISGALMVLGLIGGRGKSDDIKKKDEVYHKTVQFFDEFRKLHGSVSCRELLHNLDMNDPNDMKEIDRLELFKNSCPRYVKDAVAIIERLEKLD